MFEDAQSLVSEVQEQTMNSARDFFGNSVGSLKSQLEDDRSQLQDLSRERNRTGGRRNSATSGTSAAG